MADVKTLEKLAAQMREDVRRGNGLSYSAVMSITGIIDDAIGAPLMWPTRAAGIGMADELFPGSPTHRAGFNAGVKWAVESYGSLNLEAVKPRR